MPQCLQLNCKFNRWHQQLTLNNNFTAYNLIHVSTHTKWSSVLCAKVISHGDAFVTHWYSNNLLLLFAIERDIGKHSNVMHSLSLSLANYINQQTITPLLELYIIESRLALYHQQLTQIDLFSCFLESLNVTNLSECARCLLFKVLHRSLARPRADASACGRSTTLHIFH